MQFADMNLDALKRTTDFIVGPEGTTVIAKTYHVVAAAMQAAFDEGYQSGRYEAEQNVEERLDNAFDEGFEQGASFQQLQDEDGYDDGYLEGVADARHVPGFADRQVQKIINARASSYYDAIDEQDIVEHRAEQVIDEA